MGEKHLEYRLSRKDILDLKMGEVVKYPGGYFTVAEVDLERGIVTGALEGRIYGVNCMSIEELWKVGTSLTRWQK